TFLPADIITAFYTLQFIRPIHRQNMIQKIYNVLRQDGVFLFAEKVITHDSKLESQMIARYYNYKKMRGYTQGEIYKKREALENVLIPYSIDENNAMLKNCGFKHVEILFKWVNFTLFFARK
ncbi:carboxy-S-adenosyl-L-methionine synthase CmoA, partial [Helicobacter didelphidarum]